MLYRKTVVFRASKEEKEKENRVSERKQVDVKGATEDFERR